MRNFIRMALTLFVLALVTVTALAGGGTAPFVNFVSFANAESGLVKVSETCGYAITPNYGLTGKATASVALNFEPAAAQVFESKTALKTGGAPLTQGASMSKDGDTWLVSVPNFDPEAILVIYPQDATAQPLNSIAYGPGSLAREVYFDAYDQVFEVQAQNAGVDIIVHSDNPIVTYEQFAALEDIINGEAPTLSLPTTVVGGTEFTVNAAVAGSAHKFVVAHTCMEGETVEMKVLDPETAEALPTPVTGEGTLPETTVTQIEDGSGITFTPQVDGERLLGDPCTIYSETGVGKRGVMSFTIPNGMIAVVDAFRINGYSGNLRMMVIRAQGTYSLDILDGAVCIGPEFLAYDFGTFKQGDSLVDYRTKVNGAVVHFHGRTYGRDETLPSNPFTMVAAAQPNP